VELRRGGGSVGAIHSNSCQRNPDLREGGDVIPFDSFPNRVVTADYRRILESAKAANMNTIRTGAAAITRRTSSTVCVTSSA